MDATAQEPNTYVGIDVSKDQLDVHVHPAGESFSVSRDTAGLEELIKRLKPFALKAIAVEATGGFESIVAASLATVGLPVIVVNPLQVRKFAEALGKRAKTDPPLGVRARDRAWVAVRRSIEPEQSPGPQAKPD